MFRIIVAVIVAASTLVCSAHAAVIYTLVDQQYGQQSVAHGATLSLNLSISDQAVQRGSFNLNEIVTNPGTNYATGDLSDFFGLSWAVGTTDSGYLTPTSGAYTSFVVSLAFANGIPTGTLRLNGETSEFLLSGVSGAFSGTTASDFNNCNDSSGNSVCSVSGRLVAGSSVPEPATISVVGFGLIAAYSLRRRTSAT